MYNFAVEGVQFRATALFSFQRRGCSIHNGRGVQRHRHIQFDKDFVITLCLALLDLPQKFQVKIFTKANVKKVSDSWADITTAISDSVDLLVDFGFSHDNFTAYYIIIPVTYYLYKSKKRLADLTDQDKQTMRMFVITGMVKKIFSASVESGLASILGKLKQTDIAGNVELACKDHFDFDSLKSLSFQERTLTIEENDIEEILKFKKGPFTFMILSLLYPDLKFGEIKWHQDHIHPQSAFEKQKLIRSLAEKGLKLEKNILDEWIWKSNTLVNLQLLTGKQNQEKSKTPLSKWISTQYSDEEKIKRYCEEQYIDFSTGFELENFDTYYEKRKAKLRERLIQIFNVTVLNTDLGADADTQHAIGESVITPEGKTIAEAALTVVMEHPEGLTYKQIYDEIIAKNLYQFKAASPANIVRVEVRRRCQGVELAKSYETKWFTIVKEEEGEVYYGLAIHD